MDFYFLMPIVFLIGILCIALEDVIKVNKAATAVGMCIAIWTILFVDAVGIITEHTPDYISIITGVFPEYADLPKGDLVYKYLEYIVVESLGDVSTVLFFILASITIIEIIDSHGGFNLIVDSIKSRNKRKLLWLTSFIAFFLAALLGDLATVIVMVAILRKLIGRKADRLIFSCMIIVASNAGGSWSPIGDVTTLLLWTGGNITAIHQISHVFLSGLVMMLVPLALTSRFMIKKGEIVASTAKPTGHTVIDDISVKFKRLILYIGLISLSAVPILNSLFDMPPFMVVLLGLVVLWIITDRKYVRNTNPEFQVLRVGSVFGRVDVATIFYFLGILMSVAALKNVGQLEVMSKYLSNNISSPEILSFVLGLCSSFLDNVALVAATMGMYPVAHTGIFMADSSFWTFLAYCAVTGGSVLIIGSASGVTVMGLEKISFGYYLKRFTGIVFLGYLSGAGVYMLLSYIG